MCRNALSKFKIRATYKILSADANLSERRKLKKIYKELSRRCSLSEDGINRDQFLKFTGLTGLLGEQLFVSLDEDEDSKLDVKEFLNGITKLYMGSLREISEILFKIFDFCKSSHITSEDILCIISSLPMICHKCEKKLKVTWDFKEKISEFFGGRKYINIEEFKETIETQGLIGELVLQCIMNALPVIIDECFLPPYIAIVKYDGKLIYNNRAYYFELKNQSLYYYNSKDSRNIGIIFLSDLYVANAGISSLVLKNAKFEYILEAEDVDKRDTWVQSIRNEIGYRDFYLDYETTETIGKGAYGEVKLGVQKSTGDTVAVKIISKEPLDVRSETRLRREINILKAIKHESILELKDVYETATELYIVTDYVSGGSLFT